MVRATFHCSYDYASTWNQLEKRKIMEGEKWRRTGNGLKNLARSRMMNRRKQSRGAEFYEQRRKPGSFGILACWTATTAQGEE